MPSTSELARPTSPVAPAATEPVDVLTVEGLTVRIGVDQAVAVRDVSFTIGRGESVALVGESGSGKTLTCRSVLGLLPPTGRVSAGRIALGDTDLATASPRTWRQLRGAELAAVFQDPGSYLNPSLTIGHQVSEVLRVRGGVRRARAKERALELLAEVGLHDPRMVYHQYPFELSGGMLQRVLIAISISLRPRLLLSDEPTTALDSIVQSEILALLTRLRHEHELSVLLVTHDLAVVAEVTDRVLVMYAGEIVESGPTATVLGAPQHPYTQALLQVASVQDFSQRELPVIPGQPPGVGAVIAGCRFAARCPLAAPECRQDTIALTLLTDEHASRCVRALSQEGVR